MEEKKKEKKRGKKNKVEEDKKDNGARSTEMEVLEKRSKKGGVGVTSALPTLSEATKHDLKTVREEKKTRGAEYNW